MNNETMNPADEHDQHKEDVADGWNTKVVDEVTAEPFQEHGHVHGPNCNHDHDDGNWNPQEKTKRDAAAAFVEQALASMNSTLSKVSVEEIARQLRAYDKGSKKQRLGQVLMVPNLLRTQLYLTLNPLTAPNQERWPGLEWYPLHHTFTLIAYFLKEEVKRKLVAARAHFPAVRDHLLVEAQKQGLDMSVDNKELLAEIARMEQVFRRHPKPIEPQDVFGESIRIQPWRLNPQFVAKYWEQMLGQFGLSLVPKTPAVEEATTQEQSHAESA